MIGVIDYGLGNIASVEGAIEKLGYDVKIVSDLDAIGDADKLILPGVGAFGDGMRKLKERKLDSALREIVIEDRKPILGICLGAQLIANSGTEFGTHKGLGWIEASVEKLTPNDSSLRLPHMGWNEYIKTGNSVLHNNIPESALFYFVHTFHIVPADRSMIIGECEYGGRFVAAVQQDNIYATQFHPEKSQRHGLDLLYNYLEFS